MPYNVINCTAAFAASWQLFHLCVLLAPTVVYTDGFITLLSYVSLSNFFLIFQSTIVMLNSSLLLYIYSNDMHWYGQAEKIVRVHCQFKHEGFHGFTLFKKLVNYFWISQ